VGGVNATRLSVPVHVPLVLKNDAAIGGGTARLALSPGLLCEDTSAGDSSLSCGYQLGARLQYVPRQRDRLNLDLHHEVVNGTRRDSGSVGFAHRLGATSGAELDVALNQDLGGAMRDTRVYIQLRVPEL
jgi:hypothetical protein